MELTKRDSDRNQGGLDKETLQQSSLLPGIAQRHKGTCDNSWSHKVKLLHFCC